jgi:hypothetical protein
MNLAFYVRTKGDPDSVLSTLRAQARDLDPNVTVFDAAPLKEYIGASLYPQKIAASLMTVLGLNRLAVSCGRTLQRHGLLCGAAHAGDRRPHGSRCATRHVLGMVIRQGLALTSGGLIVGAVLAIGLARAVSSVSFTNWHGRERKTPRQRSECSAHLTSRQRISLRHEPRSQRGYQPVAPPPSIPCKHCAPNSQFRIQSR